MSKTDEPRPSGSDPTLSPAIQGKLGEQLRALYRRLEAEPLPERFLGLLKQVKEPEAGDEP
jgi:hypothetical protein